jgi:glyoxylase-like metal-dependent hydrolase (beta-lactamase superfamily II)/rhodanese-related sulfurtransferase
MYIQQIYTGCLAQAAYYIESNGEAAIVDPLRDIQVYLDIAKQRNAKIKYIFETHFHADFVSGHIDLVNKTGAKVVYGPKAEAGYDIVVAEEGQIFSLGEEKIKVLHTPGHTLESSSFLVLDKNNKPTDLFSGDTLFVGEVGRVDLAAKHYLSTEELASMLYDSIEKLKKLPDAVTVYPGHGAGSACGKNIGKETVTTIGEQKQKNYALQPMSREEFVKVMLTGLSTPPRYFFMDAVVNRKGYKEDVDSIVSKGVHPLTLDEFREEMNSGTIILDTRDPENFAKEHIPGSINIGLNGQYAIWAGSIFDNIPFILVCDDNKEKDSVMRLARVGYEKVVGYLQGGINAWKVKEYPTQSTGSVSAEEFVKKLGKNDKVLDVRNEPEWVNGMVKDSITIPLTKLSDELSTLDKKQHYYVYCRSGYRSMIAASLLQNKGFTNITNVEGGMNAISQTGIKLVMPEMA